MDFNVFKKQINVYFGFSIGLVVIQGIYSLISFGSLFFYKAPFVMGMNSIFGVVVLIFNIFLLVLFAQGKNALKDYLILDEVDGNSKVLGKYLSIFLFLKKTLKILLVLTIIYFLYGIISFVLLF